MGNQAMDDFGGQVERARAVHGVPVQARRLAEEFTDATLALLFPHFAEPRSDGAGSVDEELSRLCGELYEFLVALGSDTADADRASSAFLAELPVLQLALQEDAQATWEADPAANSVDEVLLAYPGFFAIACHRIAHGLCALGWSCCRG